MTEWRSGNSDADAEMTHFFQAQFDNCCPSGCEVLGGLYIPQNLPMSAKFETLDREFRLWAKNSGQGESKDKEDAGGDSDGDANSQSPSSNLNHSIRSLPR